MSAIVEHIDALRVPCFVAEHQNFCVLYDYDANLDLVQCRQCLELRDAAPGLRAGQQPGEVFVGVFAKFIACIDVRLRRHDGDSKLPDFVWFIDDAFHR